MHYPLLDYYRFFAASLVCITHYYIANSYDESIEYLSILGVELFFPLSGFVLTEQLLKIEKHPNLVKIFFLRRWIRTVPAYLLALIAAFIIFDEHSSLKFFKFATYTQNLISDLGNNFFSVAWSLSVEEWFYITIPSLIWILKNSFKRKLLYICISIIILGIVIKIFNNIEIELWGSSVRRSVIFRIDALCYGVLAFLYKDKIKFNILTMIITIGFIFILIIFFNPIFLVENKFFQIIFLPVSSILFSSIIILFSKYHLRMKIFSNLGLYLANLSYSIYLFHIFFIYLFISYSNNNNVFEYFISIIIFSTLFYNFFEKQINSLRPKY